MSQRKTTRNTYRHRTTRQTQTQKEKKKPVWLKKNKNTKTNIQKHPSGLYCAGLLPLGMGLAFKYGLYIL